MGTRSVLCFVVFGSFIVGCHTFVHAVPSAHGSVTCYVAETDPLDSSGKTAARKGAPEAPAECPDP